MFVNFFFGLPGFSPCSETLKCQALWRSCHLGDRGKGLSTMVG